MARHYLLILLISLFSATTHAYPSALTEIGNPYRKVVNKYSKTGEVYSAENLDARFIWSATYYSQEFRNAYAEQYQRYYPHGQEALANELGHPWSGPPQVEFFIALYAKAKGLRKLDGKENLWDLTLRVDNTIYKPALVEEVKLTPFEAAFYPYLTPWSKGYRVTFALPLMNAAQTPLILKLTSVAGKSELKFNR